MLFPSTVVVARRSGRGIGRLFVYLYQGCTTGDPVAIIITVAIAAVIVGWIVAKVSGGSDAEAMDEPAEEIEDSEES